MTILGALLTAGGLAGITLLVADPRAPLFLYVSRPVVVLAGLLLILPAILLIVLGRGASLMAEYLAHGRRPVKRRELLTSLATAVLATRSPACWASLGRWHGAQRAPPVA